MTVTACDGQQSCFSFLEIPVAATGFASALPTNLGLVVASASITLRQGGPSLPRRGDRASSRHPKWGSSYVLDFVGARSKHVSAPLTHRTYIAVTARAPREIWSSSTSYHTDHPLTSHISRTHSPRRPSSDVAPRGQTSVTRVLTEPRAIRPVLGTPRANLADGRRGLAVPLEKASTHRHPFFRFPGRTYRTRAGCSANAEGLRARTPRTRLEGRSRARRHGRSWNNLKMTCFA